MKELSGDLITLAEKGDFDVIIHGCNCLCNMGSGIAKSIKNRYPEAAETDNKTIKGDIKKLGSYSSVQVGHKEKFILVNAYTQYTFSKKRVDVNYDAIRNVFKLIKINFSGRRIAYPLIGAGLGGGDWQVISAIIDQELAGENHTLVKYKL